MVDIETVTNNMILSLYCGHAYRKLVKLNHQSVVHITSNRSSVFQAVTALSNHDMAILSVITGHER